MSNLIERINKLNYLYSIDDDGYIQLKLSNGLVLYTWNDDALTSRALLNKIIFEFINNKCKLHTKEIPLKLGGFILSQGNDDDFCCIEYEGFIYEL